MTSADSPRDAAMASTADASSLATSGFDLIKLEDLPEAHSSARLYRHRVTGAELLSLVNDDENKVFGVTFRTPPSDSTGVAHILEHLVLRGSRKYPVKDIFVEMAKGSLATFLNAFTYPDKTCYPVASQNLTDFYNLIDVYLDTVLYPRLSLQDFQQEGWHYSLPSQDAPLGLRGVVFNEMKGAYSTEDWMLALQSQQNLYPDTLYHHDSGGDPAAIPDLTYEALKDFHRKFYHPSNARFFFYGDDDPQERLRLLDRWLGAFDAAGADSLPTLQPRFNAPRQASGTYMVDAGEDGERKDMMAVTWLLADTLDEETRLGLRILSDILLDTQASPMRRALIDSGLGEALANAGIDFDLRQGMMSIGMKGIKPGDSEKVEALILSTLLGLVAGGIDRLTVGAALNTAEFQLRENNTGRFPRGIALMVRSLQSWLYGEDPLAPLAFSVPLAAIRRRFEAQERYFERLIETHLLANPHRLTVTMRPDPEKGPREDAAERQRLDAVRAGMSAAQVQATLEATQALKVHEETPNTPEALATIPSLRIADLPRRNRLLPLEETRIADTRVLWHELPTNGIAYLDLGFDLHALPADLLPYADIFGTALLETGAGSQDAVALAQRIGLSTGGLDTRALAMAVHNQARSASWLFMRGKVMPDKAPELFAIARDVLFEARLDDRERFRQLVLEARSRRESRLVQAGSSYVDDVLQAGFSEAGWAGDRLDGIAQLFFLRDLIQRIDQDWDGVRRDLQTIRRTLVDRSAMICNITAEEGMRARLESEIAGFLASLPAAQAERPAWSYQAASPRLGMTIPAKVNYVGKGADLRRHGYEPTGAASVIVNFLCDTWLYEKIRVQGGAYGGFCRIDLDSGVFSYGSYRDPNILRSLDIYDGTPGFLRDAAANTSQAELDRSIIGTIGGLDTYLLPDAKGWRSMLRSLTGESEDVLQRRRDEVFSLTPADLGRFADVLDEVAAHGRVAVLGGQEAIEAVNAQRPGFLEVMKVL